MNDTATANPAAASSSPKYRRAARAAERLNQERSVSAAALRRGWTLRTSDRRRDLEALSRVNVTGVALSKRIKDGLVDPNEDTVTFFVHRKLPTSLIDKGHKLPKSVAGFPTDVVEVSPLLMHSATAAISKAAFTHQNRVRPVSAGTWIGREDGGAGTLGLIVTSTDPATAGDPMILSSGHVLTRFGRISGANVIQPDAELGGTEVDIIGTVVDSNRFRSGMGADNRFDAAIATLVEDAVAGFPAATGLDPRQIVAPVAGMRVVVHGAQTASATGTIATTTYHLRYPAEGTTYRFANQLYIVADPGSTLDYGDSGAAILTEDGSALVGLQVSVQADNKRHWIASPMDRIASSLHFDL